MPRRNAISLLYHQVARPAVLSSVETTELWGFVNLVGLVFISSNLSEVVANILKYGWVVTWWVTQGAPREVHAQLAVGTLSLVVIALLSFWLEKSRGASFAQSWGLALNELQSLEYQMAISSTKHNIYNLNRTPQPNTRVFAASSSETKARSEGGGGLRAGGERNGGKNLSLTKSPKPAPAELEPPTESSVAHSRDDEEEEDEERDDDDRDEGASSGFIPETMDAPARKDTPTLVMRKKKSMAEMTSTNSLITTESPSDLYTPWGQKIYIDASVKFDISKVLSAAEAYMKKQQRKIHSLTEGVVKSSLASVYNKLSHKITERHIESIHLLYVTASCCLMFGVPYFIVITTPFDPLFALFLLMLSCTWLLKLISFHATLHDLRAIIISDVQELRSIVPFEDERASCLHYPNSVHLKHFVMFLMAPTLCFQFNYPRKRSYDWRKILLSCGQLLLSLSVLKIIFEQYVKKILENTSGYTTHAANPGWWIAHVLERVLKLTIPTLYCWLLMFISFFHYWMILLAEVTRFEDQLFYKDWWNSTTFGDYWRRWNLPVHHFCMRHVYRPLINMGYSRPVASHLVFILSALAHEYVVATSLKLGFTGLVFLAFVMQAPLAMITESKYVKARPRLGNCVFWIVFCLTGQPMGVMVFYWLWTSKTELKSSIEERFKTLLTTSAAHTHHIFV